MTQLQACQQRCLLEILYSGVILFRWYSLQKLFVRRGDRSGGECGVWLLWSFGFATRLFACNFAAFDGLLHHCLAVGI